LGNKLNSKPKWQIRRKNTKKQFKMRCILHFCLLYGCRRGEITRWSIILKMMLYLTLIIGTFLSTPYINDVLQIQIPKIQILSKAFPT
jgi:hypothetical protein